jgi:NAD(P)-dependent dehydrogenase (short-subunit alcohol dehydrogenase family)
VTAFHGKTNLIDYSATKGAITAFTRYLALNLCERGIRVNAIAPGPIWTPLIVASFDENTLANFGKHTPTKRAGQPAELAAAFVYLACKDSSYIDWTNITY